LPADKRRLRRISPSCAGIMSIKPIRPQAVRRPQRAARSTTAGPSASPRAKPAGSQAWRRQWRGPWPLAPWRGEVVGRTGVAPRGTAA
jgi:hypothetical protein